MKFCSFKMFSPLTLNSVKTFLTHWLYKAGSGSDLNHSAEFHNPALKTKQQQ